MASAPIEPAKLASGTAEIPSSEKSTLKVIAIIAPSAAPAETPSVSGRDERIAEHLLERGTCACERHAHHQRARDARQAHVPHDLRDGLGNLRAVDESAQDVAHRDGITSEAECHDRKRDGERDRRRQHDRIPCHEALARDARRTQQRFDCASVGVR